MNVLAAPLYIATGVLILAGVAKSVRPSATAASLRELSIPSPLNSARILGVLEVLLGIGAIATGRPILWAGVGVSYTAFSLFVLWALGDKNRIGSCGCFGREDTPATIGHFVFNAVAAAIAFLAVVDPVALSDFDGSALETIVAIALLVTGIALSIASLTLLPRTLSLAEGTAGPVVPEFTINPR